MGTRGGDGRTIDWMRLEVHVFGIRICENGELQVYYFGPGICERGGGGGRRRSVGNGDLHDR